MVALVLRAQLEQLTVRPLVQPQFLRLQRSMLNRNLKESRSTPSISKSFGTNMSMLDNLSLQPNLSGGAGRSAEFKR